VRKIGNRAIVHGKWELTGWSEYQTTNNDSRISNQGGSMETALLNIGFGNTVVTRRIIAIVTPGSAPMKRLKEDAKEGKRLIDATQGRRTRSIIITDSNHVILSAIQAETISQRFVTGFEFKEDKKRTKASK
jgi:regulator of extracellular matrix RemA (YlzA/DUF370 family)